MSTVECVLEEMRIQGLGVIDDVWLELRPGLTVITGETGAGKTMVVAGLHLLFGGRADPTRVRRQASRVLVEGRLRLPPGGAMLEPLLQAGAQFDDDGTLIVSRTVSAQGRSRAHIGGLAVPLAMLSDLADEVLAVHGQSDQMRLLRTPYQRATLDRFGGAAVLESLGALRACYGQWQELTQQLASRVANARELRQQADVLRLGLAEIGTVAPAPGEDVVLATEAERLAHAHGLRLAAQTAHNALVGDASDISTDQNALELIGSARRILDAEIERDPELAALAKRTEEISYLVTDLAADLSSYAEGLEVDPQRLEFVQDRQAALRGLTRKYADTLQGVLAWAANAEDRLSSMDTSDEAVAQLTRKRDAAAVKLTEFAAVVTAARIAAAQRLSAAVTSELASLAMAQASLVVAVRPRRPIEGALTFRHGDVEASIGPDGADDVELLLRSHLDAPALPVQQAASGGELSRVMLAVEVVFAGADPVPIMVFDEVDSGVGGRAAAEVGRRLARLARDRQVIVVTHLPQVAAYADHHLVVDKAEDGVTRSDVRAVLGEDRVRELTRMLAGVADSDAGKAHATELIADADIEKRSWRNSE